MTDSGPSSQTSTTPGKGLPRVTISAALLVLILAIGAMFLPRPDRLQMKGVFLVFDGPGSDETRLGFFKTLSNFFEDVSGQPMNLVVTNNRGDFFRRAAAGVDFILCPDGLALTLAPDEFRFLVAGRRKLPANLRPRGVMVFRQTLAQVQSPWVSHPDRTVFGDSLSLVSLGGVGPVTGLSGCAFGPDPYDHRPVLQAMRLGAFDFALVRQWDAAEFFANGLLDSKVWGMKNLTIPVPDIVVMASSKIPLMDRLKWADLLALTGREGEPSESFSKELVGRMPSLRLAGFNLLLEPDFELVRRKFSGNWPVAVD